MNAIISEVTPAQTRQLILAYRRDGLPKHEKKTLDYCLTFAQHIWIGQLDHVLVCAWGLIPPTLLSTTAYLWLFTTEAVKEHQFLFIRQSQRAMEEMLKLYPCIVGHVSIDNPQAFRWIKWLGASFGEPEGRLVPFVIRKK